MTEENNNYYEDNTPDETPVQANKEINKINNISLDEQLESAAASYSSYDEKPQEEKAEDTSEQINIGEQPVSAQVSSPLPAVPKTEGEKEKKEKAKKSGGRRGIVSAIVLIIACVLFAGGAGFGGAYLYNIINPAARQSAGVIINKVEPVEGVRENDGTLASVVADIADTVVEIRTEVVSHSQFFGNYVTGGAGSGVIISSDGYIITNNHVISGASSISVTTKDGNTFNAKLISTDAQSDIAVIKVEAEGLHPAKIGSSASLVVGQRTIAIGNPLGELGGSVTFGFISALERKVTISGTEMTLLQTDTAINPGNSGGGLFNDAGELIGIVNAKSAGAEIDGIGFAIPIDHAFQVAQNLIENGYVSGRPALGITVAKIASSEDYYKYYGSDIYKYIDSFGVYVVSDSQGNFEMGDRIVAIDDTTVSDYNSLTEAISDHQIGDTVTVTVSRSRKLVRLEVTLIERTEN